LRESREGRAFIVERLDACQTLQATAAPTWR
jgi:hypothetical protein